MKNLFVILLILSAGVESWGYASFVSYGYKTCVTCHFNGQGSGALNDYGRALFSAEIASRAFYDPKTTAEELAESSGFLGKTQLPDWYRPGIKARGLWFQTDPGSQGSKSRFIPMQLDFSNALIFDQAQKWVVVATVGYMPTPKALESSSGTLEKPSNLISREHYLRWNPNKNWFVYLGLMDKVYGIRTPDHTAFSRIKTGLAMNDQAHGMVLQYNPEKWELSFNPFLGHMGQDAELRQKGFSLMAEKDVAEKHRLGGTAMASNNNFMTWKRAEFHSKLGFGQGNSFLSELGLIQNTPKSSDTETGAYVLLESSALLTRGYNFLSQIEYYNQTMNTKSPDQIRWTFGLLMFPAPRYEVRTTFVSGRTQSDSGVSSDQWQLQAQFHMSL